MTRDQPLWRVIALAIALLGVSSAVSAQGFAPEAPDDINFIGLAVGSVPDYSGSANNTGGAGLYGRYLFSGQRYVQVLGPELTLNLVDSPNWRLGPVLRYRFARDSDVEDSVVKRMRKIDSTTEAGFFVSYRLKLGQEPLHQVVFTGDVTADTGDVHGGTLGSLRVNYFHPFGQKLIGNIGLGVQYTDDDYTQTYYGVTGSDITLYPSLGGKAYKPSGGVTSIRVPIGLSAPLSKNWMISGGLRYERLQGDAKDSPIVSERGDPDQWIYGIGAAYLF